MRRRVFTPRCPAVLPAPVRCWGLCSFAEHRSARERWSTRATRHPRSAAQGASSTASRKTCPVDPSRKLRTVRYRVRHRYAREVYGDRRGARTAPSIRAVLRGLNDAQLTITSLLDDLLVPVAVARSSIRRALVVLGVIDREDAERRACLPRVEASLIPRACLPRVEASLIPLLVRPRRDVHRPLLTKSCSKRPWDPSGTPARRCSGRAR